MTALGGSATPVNVLTDADLEENGGSFNLKGGAAIPVHVAVDGRSVLGGDPVSVYPITDVTGIEVRGGPEIPIVKVSGLGDLTGVVAVRLATVS